MEVGMSVLCSPCGKSPGAEAEVLGAWSDPTDKEHLWGVL